MAKNHIITIDVGGTNTLTALLNTNNEIIGKVKAPTDVSKGSKFLVKCAADSVSNLMESTNVKAESIKAISMGVPGTVNPETGIIAKAPNLDITDFNVKKAMQKYFDFPVLIENDVNLAGLGIKRFEFKDKVKNMLVVFVGTGIGSAFIFDGHLYRGSSFYAGEIGHIIVSSDGSLDISDREITFEGIASRTAIVNSILKDLKKEKINPLNEVITKKGKLKSKDLAKALSQNNEIVVKHIDNGSAIIGRVLANIITLLNIDTIVLGGGVIEAMGEYMMPKIKESFDKAVLPEPGKHVKLVSTILGDDAPLFGGISLANEFLN